MTPATTVLLVDDDPLVLNLYALALRQHGFDVRQAINGPAARAALGEQTPAVACVDGRLVGDAGRDLVSELARAGVRVVLFTNDQNLFDHPPPAASARLIKANTSPRQLAVELQRLLESTTPPPL